MSLTFDCNIFPHHFEVTICDGDQRSQSHEIANHVVVISEHNVMKARTRLPEF